MASASTRIGMLAIIACALLARVLIPQGWMPVETDRGWQISICSGTGPVEMAASPVLAAALKAMHPGSEKQNTNANDHPCTFSGLTVALDGPSVPLLAPPALTAKSWLPRVVLAVAVGRGLAAPPPPSTGPPSIR